MARVTWLGVFLLGRGKKRGFEALTKYLTVAAGGALGAMLRYYPGGTLLARAGAPFPTATFFINVTGPCRADPQDPAQSQGAQADIRDASIKWLGKRG